VSSGGERSLDVRSDETGPADEEHAHCQ
jgi:hypothetical protein